MGKFLTYKDKTAGTLFLTALIVLMTIYLVSCNSDEQSFSSREPGIPEIGAEICGYDKFSIEATRDSETEDDNSTDTGVAAPERAESVFDVSFNENSLLFVSQMTEKRNPFVLDESIFSYKYFYEGEETGWYDPPQGLGGYNFTPADTSNPLEWKDIKETGTYGNGYALFALYYPVDNIIRYNVEEDQSTLENLMKSDVLGAYHRTNALFTRITFRLFHLMVYIKVTVYVPIYDPTTQTGYYSDAMIYAGLQNAYKDFVMDWSALRSSDTEGPVTLFNPTYSPCNISMYQHPVSEEDKNKVYKLKYKDYIPETFPAQPIEGEYDNVRIMNFSVIIPVQKPDFAQSNFLKFIFQNQSSEQHTYQFKYSLYSGGVSTDIFMNQGILQHYNLYLPRVGSEVIMMNADVLNWGDYFTEMPLTPDD